MRICSVVGGSEHVVTLIASTVVLVCCQFVSVVLHGGTTGDNEDTFARESVASSGSSAIVTRYQADDDVKVASASREVNQLMR